MRNLAGNAGGNDNNHKAKARNTNDSLVVKVGKAFFVDKSN